MKTNGRNASARDSGPFGLAATHNTTQAETIARKPYPSFVNGDWFRNRYTPKVSDPITPSTTAIRRTTALFGKRTRMRAIPQPRSSASRCESGPNWYAADTAGSGELESCVAL